MSQRHQTTPYILMVRPANFGFNEETAANNSFQTNDSNLSARQISEKAMDEFDHFVDKLRAHDIHVIVFDDTITPVKPDAVFPNNWVTFHQQGDVILYPMWSKARREERRLDILQALEEELHMFYIKKIMHLEHFEEEDRFLEGTGSMIIDREHQIVYACKSPRTHSDLLDIFCQWKDCKKIEFTSVDAQGEDIYHTNVMMALGEDFVVICMDSIRDEAEKKMVLASFEKTGKEIIDITFEQVLSFAGNMLQVRNQKGETFLVMSEQAYQSLTTDQIEKIEKRTNILYSPIETIETFGGGSARCMMAEVFLPKKSKK